MLIAVSVETIEVILGELFQMISIVIITEKILTY